MSVDPRCSGWNVVAEQDIHTISKYHLMDYLLIMKGKGAFTTDTTLTRW